MDVEEKTMKVEKTLIFVVDDKVKITKAGKDVPFAGLQKGMPVSIKCKKCGTKMIAVRIKVLTKGAPKG